MPQFDLGRRRSRPLNSGCQKLINHAGTDLKGKENPTELDISDNHTGCCCMMLNNPKYAMSYLYANVKSYVRVH
jgi:hypothetical protein